MIPQSEEIRKAVARYCTAHGLREWHPQAALIDMDGVLYDSMPRHAAAWQRMMHEVGIDLPQDEFFLYEGMTGRATIDMLFMRHLEHHATPEEADALYEKKSRYFKEFGKRIPMPGAAQMLAEMAHANVRRVLVTGSAQASLLEALEQDYPGAFAAADRVTALDVHRGKPHPEPYLKGLQKAGVEATRAIVVENAPLGVQAAHAAGCFTVGLTTGPIPVDALIESGADIVFPSMQVFANIVNTLLAPWNP